MAYKTIILLWLALLGTSPLLVAQQADVVVQDETQTPLPGVTLYNDHGDLLGKTDAQGRATVTIKAFPVLLEKEGYAAQYVYTAEELHRVQLQRTGGVIPEVTIQGDFNLIDYLLHLRDENRPHFRQQDTTLYYHFAYSLSFPDDNWKEAADGYLAVNHMGVATTVSSFDVLGHAYFVQFHYRSGDTGFVKTKSFQKSKTMPVVVMFFYDLMESPGILWDKLTHPNRKRYQRDWTLKHDGEGNQVFSAYSTDKSQRLMETIIFDSADNLQTAMLYNPEMQHSFGPFGIFNNFSKSNGINSFRTVYTYTQGENNRLLRSLNHLSTFYKKGKTYYRMRFTATLSPTVPEQDCKVPLFYLSYNPDYPHQHGWGIRKLIRRGYDIKKDKLYQSFR